MAEVKHLAVLLAGQKVADLVRTRAGVLRLTYAEEARRSGRTPLSLSLPTDAASHTGPPVARYLTGLLPESAAALTAISRRHGVDSSDVLGLLWAIGKDCAGAVQFCPDQDVADTLGRVGTLRACTDAEIEARLDEMDTDENASWTKPAEHWSLGGTQQKFALRRHEDAWYVAQGAQATTHIVKPGIRSMRAQALDEHASMRVARRLGLDAAQSEYASFKSRDALVVTRFDRRSIADGQVERLHQEDLCQALDNSERYEEHGGPAALDVIRGLREYSATAAQARQNVARFVDGLIFNTVIGAPDAHARNFAVLLDGESVVVAPMYDVASGFAYEMSPGTPRVVSMSVGGTSLLDEIGPDAWKRFADAAGLDVDPILERVDELTELVPDAFDEVLDEVDDVDRHAQELKGRIAAEFAGRRSTPPA